jgi:hypothetical protein
MRSWGAFLAGGIALASCGGTRTLSAHRASAAAIEACRVSAQALCARAAECSPEYVPFFFGDLDTCASLVGEDCARRYEGPGATDTPVDCTAEARAARCEILTEPESAFLSPNRTEGLLRVCPVSPGAFDDNACCLRDGDCVGGRCSESKCERWAHVGEPRDHGASCFPSLTFDYDVGTCIAPAPDGTPCKHDYECGGTCNHGTCTAQLLDGDCDDEGPRCFYGRGFVCSKDKRCVKLVFVDVGATCTIIGPSLNGPLPLCRPASSYCADDHVCKPLPQEGERCNLGGCARDLLCAEGICTRIIAQSTACGDP